MLVSGQRSQLNDMWATGPPTKDGDEPLTKKFPTRCSTQASSQNCGRNCTSSQDHANKIAVISCCGHIISYSTRLYLRTAFFYPLIPRTQHCHSSMPCISRNLMVWKICFPETNHSAPFELTHLLILSPSTWTRHTCIRFHVSTSLGSSTLTEHDIRLTLQSRYPYMRKRMISVFRYALK